MSLAGLAVTAALGWGSARSADAAARRAPEGLRQYAERTNYRGDVVSLRGGLAAGIAATVGAVRAASVVGTSPVAGAAPIAAIALVGLADDILEPLLTRGAPAKGLKGHVGALRHGQLTTGNIKILGIAAASTALACAAGRSRGASSIGSVTLDAVLIASGANLLNLFDLRPGRALKVSSVTVGAAGVGLLVQGVCTRRLGGASAHAESAPSRIQASHLAAAHAALTIALAPGDLAGRTMLGDAGANVLGANAALILALSAPVPVRVGASIVTVALTLVSEKVSFSRVIDTIPILTALDAWGRQQ